MRYKTMKISFREICKKGVPYHKLLDAIFISNKLTTLVYQFLRCFILYKIEKNEEPLIITKSVITMAFRALSLESCGKPPSEKNAEILAKFNKFYESEFKELTADGKKI